MPTLTGNPSAANFSSSNDCLLLLQAAILAKNTLPNEAFVFQEAFRQLLEQNNLLKVQCLNQTRVLQKTKLNCEILQRYIDKNRDREESSQFFSKTKAQPETTPSPQKRIFDISGNLSFSFQ